MQKFSFWIFKSWLRCFFFNFSVGLSFYDQYTSPILRLPEYLIGILFGYVIHVMKVEDKISKKTTIVSYCGWILALGLLRFVFFHERLKITPLLQATYRSMWSFGICWIAFSTHVHKTGSLIRWFLSLSLWQPLSRLGFSTYIFHVLYLHWTGANLAGKSAFGNWFTFTLYLNDFIVVTVTGLIFYLFVEAPLGRILNFVWKKESSIDYKAFFQRIRTNFVRWRQISRKNSWI